MKITQLRNATIVIHYKEKVILVDPMFAPKDAIPVLKYVTGKRRRNPIVEMPDETADILNKVTHCLITHCQKGHFDHLDKAGTKWLREKNIPVFCSEQDEKHLIKKGLDTHVLSNEKANPFFDGDISLIPCVHGRGIIGSFMAHGYGYYIQQRNEPSIYLTGDTILTDEVSNCITHHQPDIVVIPAGGAKFDIGSEVIMGLEDAIKIGETAKKQVIANHLESLDHCPVTRAELYQAVHKRGWEKRFHIPRDGETVLI